MSEYPDYPADGTIAEVKAWVGDDAERAAYAHSVEQAGEARVTLLSWLEGIASPGDPEPEAEPEPEGEEPEGDAGIMPLLENAPSPTTTGDVSTADDLAIADLGKLVETPAGYWSPANGQGPTGPVTQATVKADGGASPVGNTMVQLYTVDGLRGGAAANVVGRVSIFPVASTPFGPANRVQNPVPGTAYALMVDITAGPVDSGRVPTDNGAGKRIALQPPIPNRAYVLNESWIEINSGLCFVCTTAGTLYTQNADGSITVGAARWTPRAPIVLENLDAWDAPWGPNNVYENDYVAKNAADIAAGSPPVDWLNWADAKYTTAIKTSAARRAFGPGQIVSLTGFADTAAEDAAYRARFDAEFVVANVLHPSAVGYARAAFYDAVDARSFIDIKQPGGGPQPGVGATVTSATTGGAAAGFTCTVTGTGFNANSKVYYDGVARATNYVSPTSVTTVFAAAATTAGVHTVAVDNSNTVTITVAA